MEVVKKAKKIIDVCLPEKSKNPVEIFNNIAQMKSLCELLRKSKVRFCR